MNTEDTFAMTGESFGLLKAKGINGKALQGIMAKQSCLFFHLCFHVLKHSKLTIGSLLNMF